jgi:hypothetical protein
MTVNVDRFNELLGRIQKELENPASPIYAGEFIPVGVGIHGDVKKIVISLVVKERE